MMKTIDKFLNSITMYRLALCYLAGLLAAAIVLSIAGILPYDPYAIVFSVFFLTLVCWLANRIFSKIWGVPANAESAYISALIFALIIAPSLSPKDLAFYALAGVVAMASKYIFTINKKHIFNPVAIAAAIMSLAMGRSATWWVSAAALLPFVLAGGLLIVRKMKRFDLALSFFSSALITTVCFGFLKGVGIGQMAVKALLHSPLLFFSFIMITEPLTTPPTRELRVLYGALTGFLFTPQIHIGSIFSTPELALLVGNIFSYIVSPKYKLLLALKEKIHVAPDVYDFIFAKPETFMFTPGQYLEWTLGHDSPDGRGNRRYFTIASSPTEHEIRMGIKFHEKSSSFKNAMLSMGAGDEILASQLAGDFTMPKDKSRKLVFIAGGIGITPFRSMIKYLLDKNETRPITLLYSNKSESDIVYKDVFDEAAEKLGMKTIYTLTERNAISPEWNGGRGMISEAMIREHVPDFAESAFYISGPRGMVDSFEATLQKMEIKKKNIKADYFPGFA